MVVRSILTICALTVLAAFLVYGLVSFAFWVAANSQPYDPFYPPPGADMPLPPNQGGYGPPPREQRAPIQRRVPLDCHYPRDAYEAFICAGGRARPMCQLIDGRVVPCD